MRASNIPVDPLIREVPYLEVGGVPNLCFLNVPKRVAHAGGKTVWGWRCLPEAGGLIENQTGHCVWESPEGVLREITPQGWLSGDHTGFLRLPSRFIPDDTVRLQVEATGEIGRIGRYRPLHPSPKIQKICEFMAREADALVNGDAERHRYWNGRVNDIAHKFGVHVDPVI